MRKLCISFVLAAMLTQASTITEYFDRASFEAAAGSVQVESFTSTSHIPISTGVLNFATNLPEIGLFAGDILSGVTYSTLVDSNSGTSNEFNIDAGGQQFDGGFLDALNLGSFRPLFIAFDNPVKSFGFDTNGSIGGTGQLLQIGSLSWTLNIPLDDTANHFFGFVSSARDIGNAQLSSNGTSSADTYGFAVDNFTFSQDTMLTVPEPGSLSLAAAGVAFFLWFPRVQYVGRILSLKVRESGPRF